MGSGTRGQDHFENKMLKAYIRDWPEDDAPAAESASQTSGQPG